MKPTYVRLLGRWFEKLASEGRIRADGEAFVAARPLAEVPLEPLLEEARTVFADYPEVLVYLRGCGDRLAAVLTGRESPLETLFPAGSFEIANGIYQDSCVARYLNGIVRAAFEAVVRSRPAGGLRVLEIGGGTAGTSSSVLPVLPPSRARYLFTDVSDLFLASAAEKLAAYPFVTYALLDVEKEPAAQGLEDASFDLILAANVLHATRDLRATVERVRSLLAPGGVLVLSETTSHPHYFDISTGLIEGWQSFADDLRSDNPLVSATAWVSLLREAGLEQAAAFPSDGSPASILGNHVIVAVASGAPGAGAVADVAVAGRSRDATEPAAAAPSEPELRELREAAPAERVSLLTDLVRRGVMEVMRLDRSRMPDADRGLIDLGLDSLMAVQLRNRLGRDLGLSGRLPSTLVFEHPTCSAIAAFLEKLLFVEAPDATLDARPRRAGGFLASRPARRADGRGGRGAAPRAPRFPRRGKAMKPPTEERSPLKRALIAIDELQARLAATEGHLREPIAVIGIGCRLPGGVNDPDSLWDLLKDGVDAVTEVPSRRWDADAVFDPDPDAPGRTYTRWGGFLRDPLDLFDPRLFGIAPREAVGMDPQQRLLLEVAWEALENAGQAPDRLAGTPTGVFLGICSADYQRLSPFTHDATQIDAYSASGVAHSIASGRIAYVLGLRGPAVSVDTACSSSLVAIHLACQSLRTGECRMALAAACT